MTAENTPRVGLVSMPWMAVRIPSIQLATLAAVLQRQDITAECHELFLDYAAQIGLELYEFLSNAGGFIEEWLFAREYFGAESGNWLEDFRAHRPRFGLASRELEDRMLDGVAFVTGKFLRDVAASPTWRRYDIIGFSLTISQTAPSMALARLIKLRYPQVTIVFGGSACAGVMGPAMLRICPYVDVVVRVEGERVFPELIRRIRNGEAYTDLEGIAWRSSNGEIRVNEVGPLHQLGAAPRPFLNFDSYFQRKALLALRGKIESWLPFESSRGCWYGEKNQCTFCGLHEIMAYREESWDFTLAELEHLAQRYGTQRFFSVDLIMPRSYFHTLLPEIQRRGHDWTFFYEVKANMKRAEVESLAAAGIRWIQPGIESLDTSVLKLMHKGVTALQNVQLLKWCQELGINATWNFIGGIPGEDPAVYPPMAERMRLLFHLRPPTTVNVFELHRFSPYFERPDDFHLRSLGAHPLYRYVFPVDKAILDDLVYLHAYTVDRVTDPQVYLTPLREALKEWQAARMRGAQLTLESRDDDTAALFDSRQLPARVAPFTRAEAQLYRALDEATGEVALLAAFQSCHAMATEELGGREGILQRIAAWEREGWVLRDGNRILALALDPSRVAPADKASGAVSPAPVPYLTNATLVSRA
jgi:ribosomal peptide maturation radical SAM protein 1